MKIIYHEVKIIFTFCESDDSNPAVCTGYQSSSQPTIIKFYTVRTPNNNGI